MRKNLLPLTFFLTGALGAQTLLFDARGGSLPGTVSLSLKGGQPGFLGAVILSATAGPTPLYLIDPTDPRILDVGLEALAVSPYGSFNVSGQVSFPPLPVPNNPAFVDAAIFMQGVMLPGLTNTVGPISLPRPVRFAPAGAFRDRRTQFSTPRAFFPVLPMADHRWMIAGGGSGGLLSQVAQKTTEVYDPLTDAFSAGPTMNFDHSLHTATKLANGRWLLACGVDRLNDPQTSCEVYDPQANTFTAVAPTTDPRMGHTATLLANGKVLVTGGMSDLNAPNSPLDPIYSTLKTTEIYDPAANTWAKGPDLTIPRVGHAAMVLPDGRILIAGGISWYTFLGIKLPTVAKETEIFNPNVNPPTITSGPSMGTAHSVFSTIEIATGKFLVAGGISGISLTNLGTPTAAAEIYTANSGSGTWSSAGSMAKARGIHSAFDLGGGKFLHVGGADGQIFSPNALASTEVYDAVTPGWSAGPSLTMSRSGYGWFLTPMGQIHILGGGSGASAPTVNFTEWYYR